MLPGLRFLFAAIALSISLLIFGLGAAALLRAAHQEFASLPTRPAPPEPVFASQSDGTMPSLAMLRVDEQTADQAKPERGTTDDNPADARPESSPSIAAATATPPPAAEPDSVALPVTVLPEAQNPAEVPASETAVRVESPAEAQVTSATESTASDAPVVQVPVAEVPPAAEAPGISEAPSSAETKLATTETVTPPANQPADPEPTSAAMPATDAVETKIAALNPAPNDIETQASPIKPRHRSANRAEKKRQQAERVIKRRRMARRASALRRASQAPADPFGAQPFGGFTGTSRTQ